MNKRINGEESSAIWTPLYRADLEAFLNRQEYTKQHLSLLYWLIWLPLLSGEELLRLLSREEEIQLRVKTKADLSEQIKAMTKLGLIEAILLSEPLQGKHQRYYVTDMGLYLYLSAVRPSPPLSIARLARSYPVERDDLLARLARPHTHFALASLATRLLTEGKPHYQLVSYQQPWHHPSPVANKRHLLVSDAAFLIKQAESLYAFLVYVDSGPQQRGERDVEKLLLSLLEQRQTLLLSRQHWPNLLIVSTRERLPIWAHLLLTSSFKRSTKPLAGGITTHDAMSNGLTPPIWRDLVTLASATHPDHVPLIPLSHLLRDPASTELAESFSQQRHLYEVLLKEAATAPPRTTQRLTRYVGNSLQDEATHVTRERLETLFAQKRKSRQSLEGAGLLTLALTSAEKEILTWAAHHPLLDVPTLQAVLRPRSDAQAIKPLQQKITHLFQLGLIETKVWSLGPSPLEQQRYLLTSIGLQFMAIRHDVPFRSYFVRPTSQKGDDEQLDRQWGTRGLYGQMRHTNGLYSFLCQLYRGAPTRGEKILQWKSAHEAARWYRDTISHEAELVRPDAEFAFTLSPDDDRVITVLLEYDRGTTGAHQYSRKFKAYLDYQQASGIVLPLLVVTPSHKARERMQRVLDELAGSLHLVLLLEGDLLSHGLALVRYHFPPEH